jgi:hypothetical protein
VKTTGIHVAQESPDGCVFACAAMLLRIHDVDPGATESSVRTILNRPDGIYDLQSRNTLLRPLRLSQDLPGPQHPLFDAVTENVVRRAIEEHGPIILLVFPCVSHRLRRNAGLTSDHGAILPFDSCTPGKPSSRVLHAMVVASAEGGRAICYDPWYLTAGQPVWVDFRELAQDFALIALTLA